MRNMKTPVGQLEHGVLATDKSLLRTGFLDVFLQKLYATFPAKIYFTFVDSCQRRISKMLFSRMLPNIVINVISPCIPIPLLQIVLLFVETFNYSRNLLAFFEEQHLASSALILAFLW